MKYVKHVITCKCFLPLFPEEKNIFHKFIVFSVFEDDNSGNIKKSVAQCNNCGVIHKVIDLGKSEILRKEESHAVPKIEEIRTCIPSWLSNALDSHNCERPFWQEAQFIYENKLWGNHVVLAKEKEDDLIIIKYILILGETLYKIQTYQKED